MTCNHAAEVRVLRSAEMAWLLVLLFALCLCKASNDEEE